MLTTRPPQCGLLDDVCLSGFLCCVSLLLASFLIFSPTLAIFYLLSVYFCLSCSCLERLVAWIELNIRNMEDLK